MSRFKAVVIEVPEGTKVIVKKVQVEGDSGKWFNQMVGGYFEHLYSEDRKTDFWMNEDGKFNGSPVNVVATEILYELHPIFRGQDILMGTVILTGNRGPNTGDVPAATWKRIQEMEYPAAARAGLVVEFTDDVVVAHA